MNYILILGKGPANNELVSLIAKNYPNHELLNVVYAKCLSDNCISVEYGKEIEAIHLKIGAGKVKALVNRFDSYILLHAKLADNFKVPGPTYKSAVQFKNKALMHKLALYNKLSEYRPKTKIIKLKNLHKEKIIEYPCVVKPALGAKSRGVFILKNDHQLEVVVKYLDKHFKKKENQHGDKVVLIENYIKGNQVTAVSYVDEKGSLKILSFERVLTGKDFGQLHQQLVTRTTPGNFPIVVKKQIEGILKTLIKASGISSTMLHPEFLVTKDRQVYLMEINTRIGGFRQELMKYVYGVDLNKAAIELAMGESVKEKMKFKKSATAVEVWSDESGVLKKLNIPKEECVKNLKVNYEVGNRYIAPPASDKPLASYFVVCKKASLVAAKKIIKDTVIEFRE